jgi:hypothetical protein
MGNAEHGHDDVTEMVGEVVSVQALRQLAGLTSTSSKCKGVANSQHGEMDIHLSGVDSFTAVMRVHFLGSHTWYKIVSAVIEFGN